MFEKLKEAIGLTRGELAKLEDALDKKRQRLAYLQESPLPASELAEIVVSQLAHVGEIEFGRNLLDKLGPALRNPTGGVSDGWLPPLLGNITKPRIIEPGLLVYLLREPLGEALRSAIEAWPDYPQAGPPLAERQAEISQLQPTIQKLEREIAKISEEAGALKTDLGTLHKDGRKQSKYDFSQAGAWDQAMADQKKADREARASKS